jgi:hypothetical protein
MVCRTASKRLERRYRERLENGGQFNAFGGGDGGGYGGASSGGGGYGGGGGSSDGYGGYGGSSSDGGRPSSGYGGGGGYGGYGGGYGGAEDEDVEEPKILEDPLLTEARRDLKHRLGCVQSGITKVLELVPNDPTLGELNQLLTDLLVSLDEKDLDVDTLKQNVDDKAETIEKAFGIDSEENDDDEDAKKDPKSVEQSAQTVPA